MMNLSWRELKFAPKWLLCATQSTRCTKITPRPACASPRSRCLRRADFQQCLLPWPGNWLHPWRKSASMFRRDPCSLDPTSQASLLRSSICQLSQTTHTAPTPTTDSLANLVVAFTSTDGAKISLFLIQSRPTFQLKTSAWGLASFERISILVNLTVGRKSFSLRYHLLKASLSH